MANRSLRDLIDIPALQALMDSFYRASGIPVGILDTEGAILVATGWQDICTKYHRINPATAANCKTSDAYIKSNLRVGEYIQYKCQNGMWDLATPIVIKGEHVATLFLGQFFYQDETVDTEFFTQQARRYGFGVESYLEALKKVPVFTRRRVKEIMEFYTRFVRLLIDMGIARLEVEEIRENLQKLADERAQKIMESAITLRESEEKYRQIFHDSMAVKMLIDPENGVIADVNEAACRFYGYAREKLLSMRIFDINTLTPAQTSAEMEAAKLDRRNRFNFRHRLASGEVRDVEVYSSPIKTGEKVMLHSIVHDVTERIKSERLLKCRAELSALFATASLDTLVQSGLDAAEHLTSSQIGFFHFVEDDQENLTLVTWSTNTLVNMCKAEGKGTHYPISRAGVWVDCFYQKRPVIHNDYASLPHKKGMPEGHAPVVRELTVPVIQGGKVVAIMGVGNKDVDYTQDDVEVTAQAASILYDLIERKRAEEAMRASEKRLAEAQRIAKVGDWTWRLSDNFLTWSDELYEIFGLDKAAYVPTIEKYAVLVHPDDRHIMFDQNYLENIGKKSHAIEYRIIAQDTGELKHLLTRGETEFGADGKPVSVKGTVQDITESKKAEAALRESGEKWKGLFSILPVGVSVLDSGRGITESNPELEKILDVAHQGLLTGAYAKRRYLHPDNTPMKPEEFPSHIAMSENKVVQHTEIGVVKEDGETIWTDVSAAPLPYRDATCVVVTEDITARKKAEFALQEAKKAAEEATLLKDKFVSLVAHDLKSPLTAMTGFLSLVRDDEARPLDEGAKLILDRAIDSGRQLARLIDDLLSMNRLKAGQVKLDRQFFDAKYLGAKMCADFAYSAGNKGIRLINRIPDNSRVYGDKTLLAEALQNLVANAVKFCRKGDSVTISLAETGRTSIQVQDTGPGIKPEMMERLFNYETKTSTMGSAGEMGTGFGLPLTKDIMLLHGGDLQAASEPGGGSTFTLKLPHVRPRILIVDDDPAFRFLLGEVLRKVDADLLEAEDGGAAAEMTAEGKELPHLIISDIEMPRMTGLELLSHLQKRHETQSIPVIIISGKHGMEIRDTVYNLGGKDFLTKQLDIDDFIPRVRRFIA